MFEFCFYEKQDIRVLSDCITKKIVDENHREAKQLNEN